MEHVVLDLETFGVGLDSAIVSIGAVSLSSGMTFYAVIDSPSGTVDVGAVRWWFDQRQEVRDAVKSGQPERDVLAMFALWLGDVRQDADGQIDGEPLRLWGSEDFDTAILKAAYHRNGMREPWHYQEPRGLRTVLEAAGVDEDAIPWGDRIEHRAYDCAHHAAAALRLALSEKPHDD